MADIVDAATRSRMMSGIRGRNTKIEVDLRRALFARGFRYRIEVRSLPGRPDIVLPRYRAVIFVHGCFWHAHDCSLFRLPASRPDFWKAKLEGNAARDGRAVEALAHLGWRVATVWECATRGREAGAVGTVADRLMEWIRGSAPVLNIRG
jgi:DNA mismatch endonuclease (patch repair protein)